jgi:SAM-dependent methyltransferase
MSLINNWLLNNLVCPISKLPLVKKKNYFLSKNGEMYPVVNNIPIMIPLTKKPNHFSAYKSLYFSKKFKSNEDKKNQYFIETLGISKLQKKLVYKKLENLNNNKESDLKKNIAIVAGLVAGTNGIAYKTSVGNLDELPIPIVPKKINKDLVKPTLDIGCNWGRWSIACSDKKNIIIGIDPSLGAVIVASNLAKIFKVKFIGIVGDARFLPFKNNSVASVISYSVIQHFSRSDVNIAVREISRVLKPNGFSAVQMPNKLGLRCLYHQIRRGFRDGKNFEVRYWSLKKLEKVFSYIGKTNFITDCYLGLGLQDNDFKFMSFLGKIALIISRFLKSIPFINAGKFIFSDSVWVLSRKNN